MAQRVRDKGPTKELPTVKRSDEVQEIKPAKKKKYMCFHLGDTFPAVATRERKKSIP